MARWWFRSSKRGGQARRTDHPSASKRRSGKASKAKKRDQPAPLHWTSPEQDFITRYGDPFDD